MTPLLPKDDGSETTRLTPVLRNAVPAENRNGCALTASEQANAGRSRRRSARFALLLLCLGLFYLLGCGSGSLLAFDGGGFPIGGRSKVYGIVVSAENPLATISNATVNVLSIAPNGETRTQQMTSDMFGQFNFSAVAVSDQITQIKLTVTPLVGSNHKAQRLAFTVTSGQTANVVVALPSVNFNSDQVASISFSPQVSEVYSGGDTVHISTHLLDSSGKVLNVLPSLLFIGNFGTIGSDYNFTSTSIGVGTLTALFDAGNNRQLQVNGQVISSSTTLPHPPPPPTLPPPTTEPPIQYKSVSK